MTEKLVCAYCTKPIKKSQQSWTDYNWRHGNVWHHRAWHNDCNPFTVRVEVTWDT